MDPEETSPTILLQDRNKLIGLINRLLEDIMEATNSLGKGNSSFHAVKIPSMVVKEYLERISKYAHCSNSSYVLALIYIDRVQDSSEDLILNRYCVHKLLITAVVLAAKYNDDQFFKNVYYAKVGGISLNEMNALEAAFVQLVDYNFFVKTEDFNKYLHKLAEYDVFHD